MKVAVFGAAGLTGRRVIQNLTRWGGCQGMFAADHHARALNDLFNLYRSRGLSARYLEATDNQSIRERMREVDVVISCLSAEASSEAELVASALEEGKDYLSISDDASAIPDIRSLREEASHSSSRIIVGLGWSPGLSNLLASFAAQRLEQVDRVKIAWSLDPHDLQSPGGCGRLLRAFSDRCVTFEEGRFREIRAGSWEEWQHFPGGLEWCSVFYSYQTEPLTLPLALPEVLEVQVKGGLRNPQTDYLVHTLAWLSQILPSHTRELLGHFMGLALSSKPGSELRNESGLRVEVAGRIGKVPVTLTYGARGSYLGATVAMLLQALKLLNEDSISKKGIFFPEEILHIRDFAPSLANAGIQFYFSGSDGEPKNSREHPSP